MFVSSGRQNCEKFIWTDSRIRLMLEHLTSVPQVFFFFLVCRMGIII